MNLFQTGTMSLVLALFIVSGAGCAEQEQKSKEKGKAIIGTVKDAEKNVNDALVQMQKKADQLEEEGN